MTELTFPFKNMAINSLLDFIDAYKILDFIEDKNERDPNNLFKSSIGIYESGLPNFESELLQVVSTTGQKTIDAYFSMLGSDLNHLKYAVTLENIQETVYKFNINSLTRFENEIEEETDKYFKSKDRNRSHLEEYEGMNSGLFFLTNTYKKTKFINYNFYCANQKLKYIEPEYIDVYFKFITTLYHKFKDIAVRYGRDWYNVK